MIVCGSPLLYMNHPQLAWRKWRVRDRTSLGSSPFFGCCLFFLCLHFLAPGLRTHIDDVQTVSVDLAVGGGVIESSHSCGNSSASMV